MSALPPMHDLPEDRRRRLRGRPCRAEGGVRRRGVVATLRGETLLLVAGFTIAWTALVGCMADLGENERFRLPVEMPVLIALAIGAHAAWQREGLRQRMGNSMALSTSEERHPDE